MTSKTTPRVINISPENVVYDNPFFQKETQRHKGCQIDFLIQTKDGSLYICEIKFKKEPVTPEVVKDVKEKIKRLKRPRHMSCRPVLIHVNGVSESLKNNDYFVKTIDFGDLLSGS